jgi:uncharacterized PurR-regulated membrane protein YhhQ (DUF165 family)
LKTALLISLYLISIISANLLLKHFGAYGLWVSSFLLIPFDFVVRCVFHETWSSKQLLTRLLLLTLAASFLTFILNQDAKLIAIASVFGFVSAQLGAGIFYQLNKGKSLFFKVNISDIIAISFDSIVFQFIAFGNISPIVTTGQIVVKFLGGLMWYYILFKKLHIQKYFIDEKK